MYTKMHRNVHAVMCAVYTYSYTYTCTYINVYMFVFEREREETSSRPLVLEMFKCKRCNI